MKHNIILPNGELFNGVKHRVGWLNFDLEIVLNASVVCYKIDYTIK